VLDLIEGTWLQSNLQRKIASYLSFLQKLDLLSVKTGPEEIEFSPEVKSISWEKQNLRYTIP
jgi:hypothetical protein